MTPPSPLRRVVFFVFGWTIELIALPFGVATFALIGACGYALLYLRDVGFIARNIGDPS
jgi:hypothetical protein